MLPEPLPTETPKLYCVCEEKSAEALSAAVMKLLRQGWRPVGGISVVPREGVFDSWWYFQAMAKGLE